MYVGTPLGGRRLKRLHSAGNEVTAAGECLAWVGSPEPNTAITNLNSGLEAAETESYWEDRCHSHTSFLTDHVVSLHLPRHHRLAHLHRLRYPVPDGRQTTAHDMLHLRRSAPVHAADGPGLHHVGRDDLVARRLPQRLCPV